MQISYEDGMFNYIERQHPTFGLMSAQWDKETFQSLSGVDPTPFAKVVYAPDRPMYIVVTEQNSHQIEQYTDPAQHPALNWIDGHVPQIREMAEQQVAEQLGYVDVGGVWTPYVDSLTVVQLRNYRKEQANSSAFAAFQVVDVLASVGERAGLDISAQVNTKMVAIRNWLVAQRTTLDGIATVEALRSYEVGTPIESLDADIQWVMNQVV